MASVAAAVILTGAAMGTEQVVVHGPHSFVVRQPGVGRSDTGDINCPGSNAPTEPIPCPEQDKKTGPP